MATKKKNEGDSASDAGIRLLHAHIREQFVHNARVIADNEKPERLLKMIQNCPRLKPPTRTNKELWEIVRKVRREVMGEKAPPKTKASTKASTRSKG